MSPRTCFSSFPTGLHLILVRHVGHRASCGHIRQDDGLTLQCQDVGALGHEVDTAEHDESRIRTLHCLLGKLKAIASKVSMLDDLIALIVMPQNEQAITQLSLGIKDALSAFLPVKGGCIPEGVVSDTWPVIGYYDAGDRCFTGWA